MYCSFFEWLAGFNRNAKTYILVKDFFTHERSKGKHARCSELMHLPESVIHTLSVLDSIMHRLTSYTRLFLCNALIYSPLGCPFSLMGLQPQRMPEAQRK